MSVDACTCAGCGQPRPEEQGPCAACGDTRRVLAVSAHATVTATATVSAGVKRGPPSWTYFYMIGGIVLAVALTVISVLDFTGWAKAITILVVSVIILTAFADSGRLHNGLLRLKASYEYRMR